MSYFRNYREDSFPPVIKYLLIANVLVFLAQTAFQDSELVAWLPLWPVGTPYFRPHQFFTYMFSHGSFSHLLFNMFTLWSFGRMLENRWGAKRFLNFYLISGLGAAVLHLLVQYLTGSTVPMLGASGAIMGVLAAFAYLFPNTEMLIFLIPFPVKAKYVVIGYVLIDLFGGFSNVAGDNTAHFAHLGGALTGFLLVLFWNKNNRRGFY